ncbi:MAG TPA: hypothetical protein VJ697_09775 [Nitrososphaeraceae archaeon]|nr:hypothetical protein [Nitrososphaeraceae archaeon]
MSTLVIATIGSLIQISGTSWDVTSHLMFKPETFFTPSHALLYSGIGLIIISTTINIFIYLKYGHDIKKIAPKSSFQLLLIGSIICLSSGPADYLWHQAFGIDGLLSPTHISLITGMLLTSLGIVIGLTKLKISSFEINARFEFIRKIVLIPAFSALWFTIIWYVYFLSLPFSNGENFNFNLNPYLASIIAVLFLPLLSSIIFFKASNIINHLGAISAIAGLVIIINIFSNIFSTDGILLSSIFWYLPLSFIPIIIADFLVNNQNIRKSSKHTKISRKIIAAALIGGGFYIFNYPMVVWAFSIPLEMTSLINDQGSPLISQLLSNFFATIPIMLIISLPIGAILGIIGYFVVNIMTKFENKNKINTLSDDDKNIVVKGN